MKKFSLGYLLLFISFFCLSAIPAAHLNIASLPSAIPESDHDLWLSHNQEIQIRGFWYPLSSEHGILASMPQLKSCCLQNPKKISQQLIVYGKVDSLSVQNVITLQGIFRIEPLYNQEGGLIQLYTLEQAHEASLSNLTFSTIAILIFIFAGCFMICIYYLNQSRKN